MKFRLLVRAKIPVRETRNDMGLGGVGEITLDARSSLASEKVRGSIQSVPDPRIARELSRNREEMHESLAMPAE